MGKVRLEDLDEFAAAGEQKFRKKDKYSEDDYMYGSDKKPRQRKKKPNRG